MMCLYNNTNNTNNNNNNNTNLDVVVWKSDLCLGTL